MVEEVTSPSKSTVNQRLSEQPIVLPGNPFWEILKDFGRDELIALGINAAGVGALSLVSDNPALLSLTGPALEKIGFFVNSSKQAAEVYRTTPPEKRKPKREYAVAAIRDGLPNFIRDLVAHDPLYTGLMLLELQRFPETPAWMLSIVAFLISVAAVSIGEVARGEAAYSRRTARLKKEGFLLEPQLEARFVIETGDSQTVLQELADHFGLGEIHTSTYEDTYFKTTLPFYNSRQPALRIRKRTEEGQETGQEKIQIIYTRTSELKKQQPEQYNYFPVAKDKFQQPLTDDTRSLLQKFTAGEEPHRVIFTRDYAHIPGQLLISTDQINNEGHSYTVIEVKSFRKEKEAVHRMIQVMRYIMSRYQVVQTTLSKQILTKSGKKE